MYLIGNESKRKVFVLGRGACTKNVLAALAGSKGTQIDRSGVVDEDLSPDFVFGQASGKDVNSISMREERQAERMSSALNRPKVASILRKNDPSLLVAQMRGSGGGFGSGIRRMG